MIEILGVSIDRLTILGEPVDNMMDSLAHNPMVVSQKIAQYPYRYQWHFQDGSILQLADKSSGIAGIRFEFNPNNWDSPHKKDSYIIRILKLITQPRLSRIDIAIDLKGIDFNRVRLTDRQSRKEAVYKGRDKAIETYYFGTRRSDMYIRIYNKAREQGREHYNDSDWWRCEAQINGELADAFDIIDPFEDIVITEGAQDLSEYNISTKAMLYYLRANPEAISELSVNVRTKYKELLLATAKHSELSLSQIYQTKKRDLMEEVKMWKSLTANSAIDNWIQTEEELALIDELRIS